VILFTNLQLSSLQSTDAQGSFSFQHYFSLRVVMSAVALVVVVGAAALAGFDATTLQVVSLLAIGKCLEAVSDVVHGALMRRGRFADLARALSANAALSLSGFVAAAYLTRDVVWATAGWSAGSLVTLLALNCRTALALHSTARWPGAAAVRFLTGGLRDRDTLRRLAAIAWPMGIISTLLSLQANVPQYVIQHVLGAAAVGTFAVMAYPFLLGNIAVTAMGQAAAPQFAEALRRGDGAAFRRVMLLTTGAGAALGAVVLAATWAAGPPLVAMLYSPDYAQQGFLLGVLACGAAVRYAYLPVGVAATALRRIGVQVWIRAAMIVAVTATVTAGVVWRGLDGAGLALLFIGLVEGGVWVAIALGSIRDARCSAPQVAVTVS
jgi:O-antigen/teichoic acid export membrane protein